ncbi:MAG: hypothetical protein P8L71_09905 [Flavobacteriales bacterium]|nr:hypothetical protein [Flavobacteriales bacterium]
MIEAYHTSLSKKEARKLGMRIRKDEAYLEQVIDLIKQYKYPESAKAAWVLRTASDARPSLMGKQVELVIELINNCPLSGARRDLLKCLVNLVKMKSYHFNETEGLVLDLCFERLNATEAAIAERYYSMMMLGRFAKSYPDIIPEVISSIEMQLDNGTDSFKVQGNKLIAKLDLIHKKHS